MLVCHHPRFCAILPAKTGATSLFMVLKWAYLCRVVGRTHGADGWHRYADYFTFCTVRNPYSRLVSKWRHMRDPRFIPKGSGRERREQTRRAAAMSFEQFCGEVNTTPVAEIVEGVRLDHVIHLERYVEEIRQLPFTKVQQADIPHRLRTSRGDDWQEPYRDHPHMVGWVRDWFAADFEQFRYEPEFPGRLRG